MGNGGVSREVPIPNIPPLTRSMVLQLEVGNNTRGCHRCIKTWYLREIDTEVKGIRNGSWSCGTGIGYRVIDTKSWNLKSKDWDWVQMLKQVRPVGLEVSTWCSNLQLLMYTSWWVTHWLPGDLRPVPCNPVGTWHSNLQFLLYISWWEILSCFYKRGTPTL